MGFDADKAKIIFNVRRTFIYVFNFLLHVNTSPSMVFIPFLIFNATSIPLSPIETTDTTFQTCLFIGSVTCSP